MKWQNLKNNKCPKCGKDLQWGDELANTNAGQYYSCSCGFVIGEKKFEEIVKNLVNQKIEESFQIGEDEYI